MDSARSSSEDPETAAPEITRAVFKLDRVHGWQVYLALIVIAVFASIALMVPSHASPGWDCAWQGKLFEVITSTCVAALVGSALGLLPAGLLAILGRRKAARWIFWFATIASAGVVLMYGLLFSIAMCS